MFTADSRDVCLSADAHIENTLYQDTLPLVKKPYNGLSRVQTAALRTHIAVTQNEAPSIYQDEDTIKIESRTDREVFNKRV